MNQSQQDFSDLFVSELEKNAAANGLNAASFSIGSIFAMQEQLLKIVGVGTVGTVMRSVYGVGASIAIGGGTSGAIVGSLGGLAVGVLVTAGAVALLGASTPVLIGAAVAGGLGSTAGSVFFQSLYDAYDKYSEGRGSVPGKTNFLPSDSENFDFGNAKVLEPIVIEGETGGGSISKFYGKLSKLESAIGSWNKNYAGSGVEISLNDLLRNSESFWGNKLQYVRGARLPARENGLEISSEIAALIEELKEEYDRNKSEIDEIDPKVGELVGALTEGVSTFFAMLGEFSTPIILDLDGDGLELLSMNESSASFDFLDGASGKHGWVSPDDGLLAYDKNGNGIVDDASELFGSRDMDGFSMLRAFDDNGDGYIDAHDSKFSQLKVWRDLDSDGLSKISEVHSLTDLSIKSIASKPEIQNEYAKGNWIPLISSFATENGDVREVADVYLSRVSGNEMEHKKNSDSLVQFASPDGSILEGNEADQIYVAGFGADVFRFRGLIGNDAIVNFRSGGQYRDIIDLSSYEIPSWYEMFSVVQDGRDVLIDVANGGKIILYNVSVTSITEENFII